MGASGGENLYGSISFQPWFPDPGTEREQRGNGQEHFGTFWNQLGNRAPTHFHSRCNRDRKRAKNDAFRCVSMCSNVFQKCSRKFLEKWIKAIIPAIFDCWQSVLGSGTHSPRPYHISYIIWGPMKIFVVVLGAFFSTFIILITDRKARFNGGWSYEDLLRYIFT